MSATEQPQQPTQSPNRDAEIIALLNEIADLLVEIDNSLGGILGELGTISARLP